MPAKFKELETVTLEVEDNTISVIEARLAAQDNGELRDPSIHYQLDHNFTPTPVKLVLKEDYFEATYLAQGIGSRTILSDYAGQ